MFSSAGNFCSAFVMPERTTTLRLRGKLSTAHASSLPNGSDIDQRRYRAACAALPRLRNGRIALNAAAEASEAGHHCARQVVELDAILELGDLSRR